MSGSAILPNPVQDDTEILSAASSVVSGPATSPRRNRMSSPMPARLPLYQDEPAPQHQAELFYLQKQIQSQTPMVIVMEDGETIEGCIEWYDRHALKVRGRSRMLIFKSAIKYMYKQGESGI